VYQRIELASFIIAHPCDAIGVEVGNQPIEVDAVHAAVCRLFRNFTSTHFKIMMTHLPEYL